MSVTASSQGEILLRLIDPNKADLSVDAARSFLKFDFSEEDCRHMEELAEKARQGTLSTAEQAEIENYERVNNLLGILKSKARQSLKKAEGSPS
ncbi:MAG: hypothetical protein ABIP48_29400 [Planctomycetota bacterium]